MDSTNILIEEIEQISVSESIVCSPEDASYHVIKPAGLNILHVNIRSINCNFDSFLTLLHRLTFQLDVLILSECWLSKSSHIPSIPGFDNYESNYNNQNEGIVVFVRIGIKYNIIRPDVIDANCLTITFSNELAIVALYRSPSYKNLNPFFDSLNNVLTSLKSFKSLAVIGDLNINIISGNSNPIVDEYLNLVALHGLLPSHCHPTREGNCLDHVMVRTTLNAKTLILDSFITDHAPILFSCGKEFELNGTYFTSKKTDVTAIIEEINNYDFSKVYSCTNPNSATEILIDTISNIVKKHTSFVKNPSRKRIKKQWITPGLLRCIRHRDKLYKKFKMNPDNLNTKLIYNRYRKFCNNLLKNVKREYYQNEFQKVRNNPKEAWSKINQLASINKKQNYSGNLLKLSTSPSASVDAINTFFVNVGNDLATKILSELKCNNDRKTGSLIQTVNAPSGSMALYSVDYDEIESVIIKLKDKCALGWDGISTTVVKAAKHVLVPLLSHIFNASFSTGIFPQYFKKAVVHPIFKSGDRDCVANYRPISVLNIMSKIFEKIINKRLLAFLHTNNILSENQFGFRHNKSTEDAVLELSDTVVKNFDKKLKTIGIFLDLSKAFDTVSIPILLSKLESIGVRGVVHDLFHSYLTDRTQLVSVDGINSSEKCLKFGVPQGSVLGPTLFLIYVNELCSMSIPNCKIVSYADDTVLLIQGQTWLATKEHAEKTLRIIKDWLCANLLTLNFSKTNFITFAPSVASQPTSLILRVHQCNTDICSECTDCLMIERYNSIKYLGVMIDSTMTWKNHIQVMISRVRKLIYVFKNLREIVDFRYLKTVYYALAQSIISYCITSWGGSVKSNMIGLEKAQRAVLKVLTKKPLRFPTTELYSLCQVLTVRQLFILKTVLRKHTYLPYDPKLSVTKRRFDKVCSIEKTRTDIANRHYYYISSLIYNRLNKHLDIYSLSLYKCKLKCVEWLKSLSYQETEDLLAIIK